MIVALLTYLKEHSMPHLMIMPMQYTKDMTELTA